MAIEIVDFPIENGDFPISYVSLPEGIQLTSMTELIVYWHLTWHDMAYQSGRKGGRQGNLRLNPR